MRHRLTFRGEDGTIPAGKGRCTRCEALLDIEQWLSDECPDRPDQTGADAARAAKEAKR